MISLQDKVAFLTGGTSGIGRETALTLARAGAKVVLTGRRAELGAETVRLIEAEGGEAHFIQLDVQHEDQVAQAVAATVARYGRLDIAVNNAGVEHGGTIEQAERADYQRVFDINVWGVIASMKHEIPAILQSGGGAVINVSSVLGQVGMPGTSIYTASKFAVEGLTKVAALEYSARGVRVNAVAPAVIATDMADRALGKPGEPMREHVGKLHPIGRTGQVGEVAQAILFLASDAASFITGTSLPVDGGMLAQ